MHTYIIDISILLYQTNIQGTECMEVEGLDNNVDAEDEGQDRDIEIQDVDMEIKVEGLEGDTEIGGKGLEGVNVEDEGLEYDMEVNDTWRQQVVKMSERTKLDNSIKEHGLYKINYL